jgi:hypothetical protein
MPVVCSPKSEDRYATRKRVGASTGGGGARVRSDAIFLAFSWISQPYEARTSRVSAAVNGKVIAW